LKLKADLLKVAVETARECAVARKVLPIKHAELMDKKFRYGPLQLFPVIHKSFMVNPRLPEKERVETLKMFVAKATKDVIAKENKLILSGEHTGWEACGIEGLATVEGRQVVEISSPFDYTEESLLKHKDLFLFFMNHRPPYTFVLNQKYKDASLPKLDNKKFSLLFSPDLYRKDGSDCDCLIVADSDKNYIGLASDIKVNLHYIVYPQFNKGIVLVALRPVIEDPTAICELRFNIEEKLDA
jgi:hypothetical protein